MESKIWPTASSGMQSLQPGPSEPVGGKKTDPAAARKVAQEFEALFIGMMLKSMRETTGKETLLGGGQGEDIYRSLLDVEYAKTMAARGGFGLADLVERQLIDDGSIRHEPRK